MARKSKKWYQTTFINGLIGGIFSTTIGTLIYDSVKGKPFSTTISEWGTYTWHLLLSILNFEIKLWWLLALFVVSVVIVAIIMTKDNGAPPPDYTNYKEDKFKQWHWRWGWKLASDGWHIDNLRPYCTECDTMLVDRGRISFPEVECPRCGKNYHRYSEGTDDTEILILDNIRKKYRD